MREWIKDRHAALLEGGQVELAFRQFLRWLDRNAEEIFTDGLRQVRISLEILWQVGTLMSRLIWKKLKHSRNFISYRKVS